MFFVFLKNILLVVIVFCLSSWAYAAPKKVVNVYNWAYGIAPEVLQQFEEETGIRVNYDVYDSAEVMEAKLVAGRSGYDVVVVTVWPYLSRQLEAHLYQLLDKSLIPNASGLGQIFLERMNGVDPGNQYALPYLWGTTGFAYNKKMILERFPEAPVDSLAMLFDPSIVSQFASCGVALLDSPVEVFPEVLNYLNIDPNSDSIEDLKKASDVLMKVRLSVRKFEALISPRDLVSGDYCLVLGYSGELLQARRMDENIEFVIPKEGSALWLDALAIPQDALHPEEAHIFINFLLRPEIIAKITDAIYTANCVPASRSYVNDQIKNNPFIFPSQETMKSLYEDKTHSPKYERLRLREWMRVKVGR